MASIKSTSRSLIPEMDQHVKRMLKLIDEDADSFTKKVEMYYQKRPELINLVEEVHRMYRSLADRYDHVTGELRKSVPSDLQSQWSGITDLGSEPPSALPSPGPSRRQSGHRAPGFDFFLGHNRGDESSPLESESESDDYDEHRQKLHDSEQEVARLRRELARGGFPNLQDHLKSMSKNKIDEDEGEIAKLHARYRSNLEDRDDEIKRLKAEIADKNACIEKLEMSQYQLRRKHDELADEKDDLNISIFKLGQELTSKDDMIDQMSRYMHQLQMEHVVTVAGAEAARRTADELSSRIQELEREVEKKQKIIDQGAQEKQEAMRQLCFSLEHYRNGYHRLREVVSRQNVVMMAS